MVSGRSIPLTTLNLTLGEVYYLIMIVSMFMMNSFKFKVDSFKDNFPLFYKIE